MATQDSLLPDLVPAVDPDRPVFDPAVLDGDRVDHAAWVRECQRHPRPGRVGCCRECGEDLRPAPPRKVTATRTDYEARCVGATCGKEYLAPGGRVATGSTGVHGRTPTRA